MKEVNYQYTTRDIYPKTITCGEAANKVEAGESIVVFVKTANYSFYSYDVSLVEPQTYSYKDGSGHTSDEWECWRSAHQVIQNARNGYLANKAGEERLIGYEVQEAA